MSNSDTRATGSKRGLASGITEALDERVFYLFQNWALRYIAQEYERLKGISSGI